MNKIGINIRTKRHMAGLRQKDLSDCQPTISRYETGKRRPSKGILKIIAKNIGCTYESLVS